MFFSQIDQFIAHFLVTIRFVSVLYLFAHARHVLAFVVAKFSGSNYSDINSLYLDRDTHHAFMSQFVPNVECYGLLPVAEVGGHDKGLRQAKATERTWPA